MALPFAMNYYNLQHYEGLSDGNPFTFVAVRASFGPPPCVRGSASGSDDAAKWKKTRSFPLRWSLRWRRSFDGVDQGRVISTFSRRPRLTRLARIVTISPAFCCS